MGTQNAALGGVVLYVCVETRGMNATLTGALHLTAEGLILCGDRGASIHSTLGVLEACPGRHWAFICPTAWLWPCLYLAQT